MQISRDDLRELILEEMQSHPAQVLDEQGILALPALISNLMGIDTSDGISKDEFFDVMDVWVTTIAGGADLIPVIGTGVSAAINSATMSYAIGRKDWLGAGLGIVSIIIPAFGDSLSALGKVLKSNASALPPNIIIKVAKGLSKVGGPMITGWIKSNLAMLGLASAEEASIIAEKIVKSIKEFAKGLQASVEEAAQKSEETT